MSVLSLFAAPVLDCAPSLKKLAKTLGLAGFFLLCHLYSSATFAVMVPPSSQSLQQQIEFIDQEIILLRAELAQSNQDIPSLQRYLKQLKSLSLAPVFHARFSALEHFFNQVDSQSVLAANQSTGPYRLPIDEDTVVVLLPVSGDYEVAGKAILEGLTANWPFQKPFTLIDSGLYYSMSELWELVRLYEPDFIIGPLDKQNAQSWQALDTRIPTLYLNQLDQYQRSEKALSPSKTLGLEQLKSFTEVMGLEHILVLSDQTQSATNLQVEFKQAWLALNSKHLYHTALIEDDVHKTLKKALNIQRSVSRKNWVQKTIGLELEFEPRARQDLEAVIHIASVDEAVQIKPILDFYHLSRTYSLWYPSLYPTSAELQSQQNSWQQTYAFLPPYLVKPIFNSSADDDLESKSGLFYALGKLVADIVMNPRLNLVNQHLFDSELGQAITSKQGALMILPNVFWLDEKLIQPVNEYQYPFD